MVCRGLYVCVVAAWIPAESELCFCFTQRIDAGGPRVAGPMSSDNGGATSSMT